MRQISYFSWPIGFLYHLAMGGLREALVTGPQNSSNREGASNQLFLLADQFSLWPTPSVFSAATRGP